MARKLFAVFCTGLVFIGLAGCAPKTHTLGNTQMSDWNSLNDKTKIQLVSAEFSKLKYKGAVPVPAIIKDLNKDAATFADIAIGDGIDIELSGEISLREQDEMTSEEESSIAASKELAQLTAFMESPDGKELIILNKGQTDPSLNDAKQFSDKIKQLTTTVRREQIQAQQVKSQEQAQQAKIASCPLKIAQAYTQPDSINTPEAYVIVKNVSAKTVDAYKVAISCYDSFGEPVNDIVSGDNIFNGIAQNENIGPGQTYGYGYSWMLAEQDTTTKITAQITEVHFTDGTTWSLDN